MFGASRESMAKASTDLDALRQQAGFDVVADELFAVAALLADEPQLRTTLADAGQPAEIRQGLLRDVFDGKVNATTMQVLQGLVSTRWSTDMDLVFAIERLGAQAAFTTAEAAGELDQTEEELFRFGRAVDASSQLQMALTNPAQSAATKANIVRDLLNGRGTKTTLQVLSYFVGHLHGQRLDSVVDQLCDLAAEQRERVVAEVRVAAPLTDEQMRRLQAGLSALKDRTVRLNVAVDPSVLGGVHVVIGDEVIDGTVAARLEQARRAVLG
jgi:F-type H+-transporting ATPase subunit delta